MKNIDNSAQTRLAYIDGWRFIAVALVIISHLSFNKQFEELLISLNLNFLFIYGRLGVLIFFFISGLVVSKAGLDEIKKTSTFSISRFYTRRAFRIIPPLMIYLFFCLYAGSIGLINFTPQNFLSSTFYLCNTSIPFVQCGFYASQTWSLAFEEQYYLIFPIILCFVELKKIPRYFSVIFLFIFFLPFFYYIPFIGKIGFLTIHALFIIGYIASKYKQSFDLIINKSPNIVLIVSVIFSFILIPVMKKYYGSDIYSILYTVSIPLMVLSSSHNKSILRALLTNKIFCYFGIISYSIYLWQQFVTSEIFSNVHYFIQLSLIAGVFAYSAASYELFEKRMIQLGRKVSISNNKLPPPS